MSAIIGLRGERIELQRPEETDVSLDTLAHGIANICRFQGHTRRFYSVAEHSVLAAVLSPPESRALVLIHDLHEAIVGDVPSPLKPLLGEAFAALERSWESWVYERFLGHRLDDEERAAIKLADVRALALERVIFGWKDVEWWTPIPAAAPRLHDDDWAKNARDRLRTLAAVNGAPEAAKSVFLTCAHELGVLP